MKYVVVLPAKDEERTIRDAIESMAGQTIPPRHVLVVDDHSTDSTPDIVKALEVRYPFISHHGTTAKKQYELGGHVVRLFMEGKRLIDAQGIEYDWIVKLDADLKFESDFMERIESRIRGMKIGIVSGTPYYDDNGAKIYDKSPTWHTHGQFKIYNATCLNETGGPPESLGWDCADNIVAMEAGWKCIAISDINYLMHRKVGGKTSIRKGRVNHGIGSYLLGYDIAYFLLKVMHDLFKPPLLIGACSLIAGYVRAALYRYPRILSAPQQRLLRKLLWSSLWVRFRNMDFVIQQKLFSRKQS